MPTRKLKEEEIRVYLTVEQKNQIKRMANINNQSLSKYLLNAVMATSLDTAKMDFYQSINADQLHIKKSLLVLTQLMLLIGSEQLKSQDQIMEFYRERVEDAEQRFGRG
ncbi:hypothetical protein [Pelosinus propionicus]|uniref:Uncharacterized protein n=1 Tax=Pelosinus propionicus DSM 13327 TaxID=1123291 RepID=A0A1I4HQC9_9FIRM|nr:hypothetical protein [Pelosinus propionicus]SFL43960.1 hypothetical protein SAMN04490355_1004150 [Pelosinus propionicus DSM 13327]